MPLKIPGYALVLWEDNKGSLNQFSANKKRINLDIDKIVQRPWDLESYGTIEIEAKLIMTEEKPHVVKKLETITHVSNSHYTIVFLWKGKNITFPNNRALPVSQFLLLENKINTKLKLKKRYADTIQDHINKEHATHKTNTRECKINIKNNKLHSLSCCIQY